MSALPQLLLQVAVVVAAARAAGMAAGHLGQPRVVGEMAAGLALGPSVLGALAPAASRWLFPPASLAALGLASQLGVVCFVLLLGADLDLGRLRALGRATALTGGASMAVPLLLGAALGVPMHRALGPPSVGAAAFAAFVGIAMSVTAFPVLARILEERGLADAPLGLVALACAAACDVLAWCALAVLGAWLGSGSALGRACTLLALLALMIVAAFGIARPLLRRLPASGRGFLPAALLLGLACAAASAWIGVHALFGAFVAGLALPRDARGRQSLRAAIGPATTLVLLPLFFAVTGLRTDVRLLAGLRLLGWCALVIAVAVAGKVGGSALGARLGGFPWRQALCLGVLLNTRGLVELVLLGVGRDLGVLDPTAYSMLVVMALVTTAMTAPLLDRLR